MESSCVKQLFPFWKQFNWKEAEIKGFALDDDRLKNGRYLGKDYFREPVGVISPAQAGIKAIEVLNNVHKGIEPRAQKG